MHKRETFSHVATYIILTIIGFFLMLPFFWMISTSFKPDGALMTLPIQWIPKDPTMKSYTNLFEIYPFARIIFNSLFVSISITFFQLIISAMAAFVFAKIEFKGREKLFLLYIATMMIPFQVIMIPWFMIMNTFGLIDTYISVIVPCVFSGFAVFLMRQSFMTIPDSYIESAFLEGAGYFRVFFSIILPLEKGIIATVGVITFLGAWNDYMWPLVTLTSTNMMTLPVALSQLNGQYDTKYNILMAGSLISMIPILIVYIFGQKYFTQGMQVGGIKG